MRPRTLNPVWDEAFPFANIDMDATVVVTVFDHDLIGSHDFLGKVEIPIHSLPLGKVPTPLSLVSDFVETGNVEIPVHSLPLGKVRTAGEAELDTARTPRHQIHHDLTLSGSG